MPSADYDAIVVGAGHNGLIAAGYLAQAGYRVGVFERRSIVGGAVSTEEQFPGYQIDLGGSAHILIRSTPIPAELELGRYGLEYIELDPLFFAPFEDGDALFIYRDEGRTIDHLEQWQPGSGQAYRTFLDDWRGFARTMRDMFLTGPSPFELGKTVWRGDSTRLAQKSALRHIMRPYGDVLAEYFPQPKLRAALTWMAAQSGPPPTEPLTGPFALWHPLYHESGIARPRGGSGMLTQALRRQVEACGGDVHTDAPVQEILVRDGRVRGVRVHGQVYTAEVVCAATHAYETFMRLLPEQYRPEGAATMRIGNGFGAILRLALDGPVRYIAHPGHQARVGLQLLCEDVGQITRTYGEYLGGHPATRPPIVAMTFSAVDSTLAPPGGEVLWLWAQYFPYELAGDARWADIAPRVRDEILDRFEVYAPGTRDKIVGELFQHPAWLERHLGLYRGNVMHLEMSLDQMFGMRPLPGYAGYRGPVDGLYLSGASTHPGGGIMGASGRNAARVMLGDLDRRIAW